MSASRRLWHLPKLAAFLPTTTMPTITTGITNAPLACRLEIRTFLQDKDVFNLYVLAMDKMQKTVQTDPSSWFQLAGIHGRPYVPWDNVGEKGTFAGYCCHSSVLFPVWHRPYLALFEQTVSKHIFEIANKYPHAADKKKYLAAAQRFRLPYWDWALDSTLPDIIAKQQTIAVHAPDGDRTIKNPILCYNFNPVYSDNGDGSKDAKGVDNEKMWELWKTTVRYPTTTDSSAKSQPDFMQAVLKNNSLTLRDRTYNLLTQAHDWFAFSHDGTKTGQPPADYDSIESIHNEIHGLTGRNGHMGVVDYAAFDPIFWLHHANLDRILLFWQALNPNVWVTPAVTETGTFTAAAQSNQNVKTDLTPFRTQANPDRFWTAEAVRDTRVFNYTYPEFEKWASLSDKEKRFRIHTEVHRLYGKTPALGAMAASAFKSLKHAALGSAASPVGPATTADHRSEYHEWMANIVVKKYAVNSTFFVHVFLGTFNSDSKKWAIDSNLVGSHVIFANNAAYTGCERCRDHQAKGKLVTGMIPLTTVLASRLGGIDKLGPELVLPYLKKNLKWSIQRHDGTAVDHNTLPSLKVTVGRAAVQVPQSSGEFGSWGELKIHPDVGGAYSCPPDVSRAKL